VLVADDSPTIQKKALGILRGEGFEVETVSNGVAAVKRLAFIRPVVILADVSMPGRDGYEVCEYVKNSADHAHVPVLLIASDMEPYDESRGAQVRADGKVIKPFEPHDLISVVERFAAQCEASAQPEMGATQVMTAPMVAPTTTPEFHLAEEAEEAPTILQSPAPDFTAASEGIAFSDSPMEVEASHDYSAPIHPAEADVPIGIPPAEVESAPARQSTQEFASFEHEATPLVHDDSVVFEEPAPPAAHEEFASFDEPPAPAPAAETPLVLVEPEAAAPEPVFIEEQVAPPAEPPSSPAAISTMIFRTPIELAEPVWRDETAPAAPPPEPAAATALEPQLAPEPESPAASSEITAEFPAEPEPTTPQMAATSLDSFSLDDATAGQVRFVSQESEASFMEEAHTEAAPTDVAPPMEAPAEPPAETAAEVAPVEAQTPTEAPAPAPQFDLNLVFEIVHRVVVRMSPPALPKEVTEEMARRLADEIAAELSQLSAPPQQ
jgi:CheY-like chemotaxis protein